MLKYTSHSGVGCLTSLSSQLSLIYAHINPPERYVVFQKHIFLALDIYLTKSIYLYYDYPRMAPDLSQARSREAGGFPIGFGEDTTDHHR